MEVTFSPLNTLGNYRFSVILARYQGGWVLSRRRGRTTWETPGGHIEKGESPLEAACRELYEETGALEYAIQPLFDYRAGDSNGMVFLADIGRLGGLPDSEMAECRVFAELRCDWTYPQIQPAMFAYYANQFDGGY